MHTVHIKAKSLGLWSFGRFCAPFAWKESIHHSQIKMHRDGKDDDDDDDGDKDQVDGGSSVAMWPGLSENLKSWSARSGQFLVLC